MDRASSYTRMLPVEQGRLSLLCRSQIHWASSESLLYMGDLSEVSKVHQFENGAKDIKTRLDPHNPPGTTTSVRN